MLRSSVSSRISWHSDIYWAVRRWQIYIKSELSEVSSSILKSVFYHIEVPYLTMNIQETKLKGLSESRFGSMIFFLRMAGIPLKMKKIKPIYSIYMVTVIICSCITFIGVFVDAYIQRDDLRRAMKTARVLFSITNIMWLFSYSR
jgi:hypothetical protein